MSTHDFLKLQGRVADWLADHPKGEAFDLVADIWKIVRERAADRDDEAYRISVIIERHLQHLRSHGWIVALGCGDHVRDDVVETADGDEVCGTCSADGYSGELGELGLDSVAIEIAEKIVGPK